MFCSKDWWNFQFEGFSMIFNDMYISILYMLYIYISILYILYIYVQSDWSCQLLIVIVEVYLHTFCRETRLNMLNNIVGRMLYCTWFCLAYMRGGDFKRFFMFTPTWGNDPIWLRFFNWNNHHLLLGKWRETPKQVLFVSTGIFEFPFVDDAVPPVN